MTPRWTRGGGSRMRREFVCDGRSYEVGGERSEWVLQFWDDEGVDVGCARNRAGGPIHELTDQELCLHLAEASKEPTLWAATVGGYAVRTSVPDDESLPTTPVT